MYFYIFIKYVVAILVMIIGAPVLLLYGLATSLISINNVIAKACRAVIHYLASNPISQWLITKSTPPAISSLED